MMSQQLPFLLALACPLGMAAMMGTPVLVRRFRRRADSAPESSTRPGPIAARDAASAGRAP